MSKKQYTALINKELFKIFKENVESQNKSLSGSVEEAIKLWLEERKKLSKK